MKFVKFSTYIQPELYRKFKAVLKSRGQTFAGWLNSKMEEEVSDYELYKKKRNALIALALIGIASLSYLSMRSSSQELPLASPCSPMEPTCSR